jgi:uncharacterized protein (UPF0548 family)
MSARRDATQRAPAAMLAALPFLRPPAPSVIEAFLARAERSPSSYREVGATRDPDANDPIGYRGLDHVVELGRGDELFARAREALLSWEHFRLGWVEIARPTPPVQEGSVVAVIGRFLGTCWLNAARVVWVQDEGHAGRSCGFAYGTLEEHMEQGEERFVVSRDQDGYVSYAIHSFSRPSNMLGRIAAIPLRGLQRRFLVDSGRAMQRAAVEERRGAAAIS